MDLTGNKCSLFRVKVYPSMCFYLFVLKMLYYIMMVCTTLIPRIKSIGRGLYAVFCIIFIHPELGNVSILWHVWLAFMLPPCIILNLRFIYSNFFFI